MQDLPNDAPVIGYTNILWTLGADVARILLCHILKHLKKRGGAIIHLEKRRMLELNSTYVSKAENDLQKLPMAMAAKRLL